MSSSPPAEKGKLIALDGARRAFGEMGCSLEKGSCGEAGGAVPGAPAQRLRGDGYLVKPNLGWPHGAWGFIRETWGCELFDSVPMGTIDSSSDSENP